MTHNLYFDLGLLSSAGSTVIVYVPATDETRVWFPAGALSELSFY